MLQVGMHNIGILANVQYAKHVQTYLADKQYQYQYIF